MTLKKIDKIFWPFIQFIIQFIFNIYLYFYIFSSIRLNNGSGF